MSRHGYTGDCDDELAAGRWRGVVKSAIRGKRGQAFLKELADALDAMPVKELISEQLVDEEDGGCCAIGAVCKARGLDVSKVDCTDPEEVGALVGIARQLAAEIEYQNDDVGERYEKVAVALPPDAPRWHDRYRWERVDETPAERWTRMRKWVEEHIKPLQPPCRSPKIPSGR